MPAIFPLRVTSDPLSPSAEISTSIVHGLRVRPTPIRGTIRPGSCSFTPHPQFATASFTANSVSCNDIVTRNSSLTLLILLRPPPHFGFRHIRADGGVTTVGAYHDGAPLRR